MEHCVGVFALPFGGCAHPSQFYVMSHVCLIVLAGGLYILSLDLVLKIASFMQSPAYFAANHSIFAVPWNEDVWVVSRCGWDVKGKVAVCLPTGTFTLAWINH